LPAASSERREAFRFREFELDVTAYELRRHLRRVHLERLPMDLLILLVQRPGELIPRSEIVERLWGRGVFIDVETALNAVVRKLGQALNESAGSSDLVEIVPGRGCRFLAPVEVVVRGAGPAGFSSRSRRSPKMTLEEAALSLDARPSKRVVRRSTRSARRRRIRWSAPVAVPIVLIFAIGAIAWYGMRADSAPVRLAIMPFEPAGVDSSRSYLPDALHEETIAAVRQVDPAHLVVVPRRSTLRYVRTTLPPLQIAQELHAEYLVQTIVGSENGRIRVIPTLIRARDREQIWTRSYETDPRSLLQFHQDLGAVMTSQIGRRLTADRVEALARRQTANPEAFQLYLQGLAAGHQYDRTMGSALDYYARATALDPDYALSWARLALALAFAPIDGDADPRVIGPQARRAAQRAMASGPQLAESLTAMGAVNFWFDWDWSRAETMFRNAVAADPSYTLSRRMAGTLTSHQARHDDAKEHMRRLVDLEPAYEVSWAFRSQAAFNAAEYPVAVEFARRAKELEPDSWVADYHLAMAHERIGDAEVALQTLGQRLSAGGSNTKLLALRGYLFGRTGRSREARDVLSTLEAASHDRYVPAYARALVLAGLGERDSALEWLERAYEERDVHLIALATDPKWDPFRSDPAFNALIRRCGFVNPLAGNSDR
jgi:TolB-like protein/DNA-binding winged helix-turn-helix (wHTH) protein